jgi:pilus assembly protein Flp/PilA
VPWSSWPPRIHDEALSSIGIEPTFVVTDGAGQTTRREVGGAMLGTRVLSGTRLPTHATGCPSEVRWVTGAATDAPHRPRKQGINPMRDVMNYSKARFGFATSEEGATAVEYGILVALIAVAIIVAVTLVGTNLNITFNEVATNLS